MICSSTNWRTISVIAFCSSVFSRYDWAATAMRVALRARVSLIRAGGYRRGPSRLGAVGAGGLVRQRHPQPHDGERGEEDPGVEDVQVRPAHVGDHQRRDHGDERELDVEGRLAPL